ncbi:MAG: cytidylyltransferase domain-containing protein, partial [Fimbriimonadaceae bacterium]
PARGGSKRIPKQNIVPLAGKPMIAYTVDAALGSKAFDRVLVSTDSAEIAETVERECGLEVPFLRNAHADDASPVSQAVIQALDELESHQSERYEQVVMLMANCPLRTAKDIRQALDEWEESGAASAISCFAFGWMNPWWAFRRSESGEAEYLHPAAIKQRSQDLETLYCLTGAVWASTTEHLRRTGEFKASNAYHPVLDWQSAVDIDDQADLELAEVLMLLKQRSEG